MSIPSAPLLTKLAPSVREQQRWKRPCRGVGRLCHRALCWRLRCVSSNGENVLAGVWGGHATALYAGAFGAWAATVKTSLSGCGEAMPPRSMLAPSRREQQRP